MQKTLQMMQKLLNYAKTVINDAKLSEMML